MKLRIAALVGLLWINSIAEAQEPFPTPGNPPRILLATSIDADGNLLLVSYRTIYIGFSGESYNDRTVDKVSLAEVQIVDTGGKEVTLQAARERIKGKETPILVTSWHEPLSPAYKPLFTGELLLFKFPKQAPDWKEIQDPSRPLQ